MQNLNIVTQKCFDCTKFKKYMLKIYYFWSILLVEDSIIFTIFLYKNKYYQFKVFKFGLFIAGTQGGRFCKFVVGDILVILKLFREHLKRLNIIFSKLWQANLELNYEKWMRRKPEITFLGYITSVQGDHWPGEDPAQYGISNTYESQRHQGITKDSWGIIVNLHLCMLKTLKYSFSCLENKNTK